MSSELSKVFQIDKHKAQPKDKILVDTQILVWLSYSYCPKPQGNLSDKYGNFIKNAASAGALLYHCPLQVSEVANVIERTEHNIYTGGLGKTPETFNLKDFRKEVKEHNRVAKRLRTAWELIQDLAPNSAELCVTSNDAAVALDRFDTQRMGAYDVFLAEAAAQNKIQFILTADRDFLYSTGLLILTADLEMVDIANKEGRLLTPPERLR